MAPSAFATMSSRCAFSFERMRLSGAVLAPRSVADSANRGAVFMRISYAAFFLELNTIPAAAAPITTTYTVQFISVCDDNGASCAPVPVPLDPTNPARDLNNHLDVMNRAYEQAGIRFLPVMSGGVIDIKRVNSTALLNPDLR